MIDDEPPARDDEPRPIDWNNPIPGNTHAIQGEIDRVKELRDRCHEAAKPFRHLGLDSWSGPAAEQFESFTPRLVRQWADAEDEHDRWADALASYREVLLTLQPLARAAVEQAKQDGSWTQAHADIQRWREQADSAARATAGVLHDVAARLRALPLLLDEQTTKAVAPAVTISQPSPDPGISARNAENDRKDQKTSEPGASHQSPAERYERVTSLCDAVLDAEFISGEEL